MPKETKKITKKNPILADEDTLQEEETTTDETQKESEEVEESEKEASKKVIKKKAEPVQEVAVNSAQGLNSDIAQVKATLQKEEQVAFMVPLAEGEKPGAVHDCFINGFKFTVKKGVMTRVPESIANLLADHYKITSEAGSGFRLDLNEDKLDNLS